MNEPQDAPTRLTSEQRGALAKGDREMSRWCLTKAVSNVPVELGDLYIRAANTYLAVAAAEYPELTESARR